MTDEQAARRGPDGLRAVRRAADLLAVLARYPAGISLADLARTTDYPMTTVHRILGVLRETGLVRETPDGQHALGAGTVVLAGSFLDGLDVRAQARPVLLRLAEESAETCHLGVLAGPLIVYIDKIDSRHPVRMVSRVGGTNPASTTAIGKSILAWSPQADRLAAAAEGSTVDDSVLATVRTKGFATDLEGNEPGICCVGAPIFDHAGQPIAALSVSTPTARFAAERVDEFGALVRDRADEVSRGLGWRGEGAGPALGAWL
ncbi:MAG TPA: IclR family transcriptional regulator [Pseudonocardiaceae bacterium]|nr:IclR family transcriptional regulator [Pseudonocardiaceae bacterium]